MTTEHAPAIPSVGDRVKVTKCLYDWPDHNERVGVVTATQETPFGRWWTVQLVQDRCWAVGVERIDE